ncbi:phage terminase, small subunit, putative, P27 family [Rhodoblastus acidophilus]|uniref:Phage terminase, small subunit, putative, P27 family n=1 Tax=Rhodoblastus acidophilus TaxID=1074 RepID=A0A212SC45_RHOAC|nr:P27 family phage terminase small subunit [Rhodoblastus acidophilus]PPQ35420.1 hypothetical protein CKO16_20675 [Rhodoblastus acidophilus]RAI17045.1 hypothetical protein CH337_18290 [Rhodoblastus acidophilus]SNB83100.1 phage terminase, small subunit, putative, P27 family [Rhodoblastus acidophilus]
MRGRVPNPAAQIAKGNPGKRLTKAQKILAEANECAEALAPSIVAGLTVAPPKLLERFPAAMRFWKEYAPALEKMRSLQPADAPRFAMLCMAYGQWVEAIRHLRDEGCVHSVKTVSGDKMKRLSPWVAIEKLRFDQCQELFEQFGFGAMDRAKLMRDRAALPPGAWSAGGEHDSPDKDRPDRPAQNSPVGSMDLLDSAPPGAAVN